MAGEELESPPPHDEAEQTEPVTSPPCQGGEAAGSHPPEPGNRGAARSALDGESLGPGWQGAVLIPTGPWRLSEDPRGDRTDPRLHPQVPLRLPEAEQRGSDPVCPTGDRRRAV